MKVIHLELCDLSCSNILGFSTNYSLTSKGLSHTWEGSNLYPGLILQSAIKSDKHSKIMK